MRQAVNRYIKQPITPVLQPPLYPWVTCLLASPVGNSVAEVWSGGISQAAHKHMAIQAEVSDGCL